MHFKHEFIIKNAVQMTRFFWFTSNCEFNEEDERKYFWQKSRPQWIVIHIGSEATYHHNRRCHPPCCLRCCCCCRLLLTYRVVILTRWVILSALSPSDELWTESVSFCLPNRRRQQSDGLGIALHALRVTHHDRENTGKLRPTKNIRKVQAGKETAIFYRSKNLIDCFFTLYTAFTKSLTFLTKVVDNLTSQQTGKVFTWGRINHSWAGVSI